MQPNLRLKRERERRGWSQVKVARELGTDPRSISRWEHGLSRPYPHFREKLRELFEMDLEALGLLNPTEENQIIAPLLPSSPETSISQITLFDPFIPLPATGTMGLVGRDALLHTIKQRLLNGEQTLLRGLPGVGKTAIACTLAHDPEIQAHFHAGILWAGVGPEPNLPGQMSRWGMLLNQSMLTGEQTHHYEDWAAAIRLGSNQQRMLFIIDDVWKVENALALKLGGNLCTYLFTTRIPQVAQYFAPEEVWTIRELNMHESLELLARFVPKFVSNTADQAHNLIQAVGGHPLALTLIGKYLRAQAATNQPRRLAAAIQHVCDPWHRLRLSSPSATFEQQPSYQPGTSLSLQQVIAVSEQHIDRDSQQALHALSIFPAKPNSFSEEAALAVCRCPVEILDKLSDAGLLESPEPGRYQLHQTIADYARAQQTQLNEVQNRFVTYMTQYAETNSADYAALEQESHNILTALEIARGTLMSTVYMRCITAFAPFLSVCSMDTQAIEHLLLARQFALAEQNFPRLLPILAQLGCISRQQQRLVEGESYFQEGLAYARHLADNKMVSTFLFSLAEVLEQRGEYAQAQVYLQEEQNLDWHHTYKSWALYQRGGVTNPTEGSTDHANVYFTEPHDMLQRGVIAAIDEPFHSWKYAHCFSPTCLKVVQGPEGHIYGVPSSTYVLGLAYNRRLFRMAGLDPDRPPTTWEDFRTIARLLTNHRAGVYGFVETTMHNMGGWHFTNWLYTAGIQPQRFDGGRWQAAFNHPKAAQFLEMVQQMRFVDRSIPDRILLSTQETNYLFWREQVAMIVSSPEIIMNWHKGYLIDREDIGLAPMPQNGGNACLMGGTAYVFNANLSPRSLQQSFANFMDARFHLDDYETVLQAATQAGCAIGISTAPLFIDPLQRNLDDLTAKYANIPPENYQRFMNSTLTPLLEPPIATQKYYALLDPVIQAVLTNAEANPQHLLDLATQQFQERFLENVPQVL